MVVLMANTSINSLQSSKDPSIVLDIYLPYQSQDWLGRRYMERREFSHPHLLKRHPYNWLLQAIKSTSDDVPYMLGMTTNQFTSDVSCLPEIASNQGISDLPDNPSYRFKLIK
ncbi:unnamed protein product [Citrullus colocynthis]|uniref:Uncharacterized protein n=1 Tax=Citrullus colocynthis TaxID=252529 RepID=A0ABP0XYR8_9ROSI